MSALRRLRSRGVILAVLALSACGSEEEGRVDLSENTAELTVEETGRVGARVYLEPERAEAIVSATGLTPEAFEARVRSIANDPERSLAYARAFEAEVVATPDASPEGGP